MNKKQLEQINKNISASRTQIKFQNTQLQKIMVEQLELSMYKMLDYIKDQSDFLKTHIGELREMKDGEFSVVLLDALYDTIRQTKKDVTVIRRAYEDAKQELKNNINIEELNLIIFHSTELNELIRSLDRVEKVLFSYPPPEG